jgi:hypothetical protein
MVSSLNDCFTNRLVRCLTDEYVKHEQELLGPRTHDNFILESFPQARDTSKQTRAPQTLDIVFVVLAHIDPLSVATML